MARRMPQASSSLKALTITRPRQGRTRHMLGRERPPLYAPCLDRSERSSPLLHPPSKQDLPASVPALVGADQHHLSGLGLPTTLPEGSKKGPALSSADEKAGPSFLRLEFLPVLILRRAIRRGPTTVRRRRGRGGLRRRRRRGVPLEHRVRTIRAERRARCGGAPTEPPWRAQTS